MPTRPGYKSAQILLTFVASCLLVIPGSASAQGRGSAPDSLSSAEFWEFFKTMSESGGTFLSENFVSNEVSFQDVIPTLKKTLTKDGVYLGVGPEQNFTYIANLTPRLAVIFDIRRQNAMQHLMYKALFELSPTRAEFVSRLFSRPSVGRLDANIAVKALFDSAGAAARNDSAYQANLAAIVDLLTNRHGFELPATDIETIKLVYKVFFNAGPDVNYGYRSNSPGFVQSTYPTFGMLQSATNADTVQMAFLSSEAHYHAVRGLQLKNLIVPVVGDFGGPSAIKSVAKWLKERELLVTAFYVSNVEQYLWRESGQADRFYANVSALPLDSTSHFIRSVPRAPTYMSAGRAIMPNPVSFTITTNGRGDVITSTIRDSAGVQVVQTKIDSTQRARVLRDSSGSVVPIYRVRVDSVRVDSTLYRMMVSRDSILAAGSQWQIARGSTMQVVMGGTLTSGIASMDKTLKQFFLGELKNYNSVVDMTKVSGWR